MNKDKYNKDFNEVILKIATQFINIPFEDFSIKVQESLELIGSFLDLDRAYVFEYNFYHNTADNTYEWCHEGVEPQIDYLRDYPIVDMLDDWVVLHKNGQDVIYEDVSAIDHDSYIYKTLAPQGIQSICTIPLIINDNCFGFVGFDDIRQKRKWTEIEINLLRILAELIVNAIYKHKNDELLHELKVQAQKESEAKGQFLAQMSHEIRTPLNGIYNAFHLMKSSKHTIEQARFLEIAHTSLDVLSSVINNILDMSKIEAGKMEVIQKACDFESEITKVIKTLRPSVLEKNLSCLFEYDYSINYEVVCDINKINQIMLNLVNNAIKFTDKGYVKTKISVVNKNENEYLSLVVEDTGQGISQVDQQRIFDAFYQSSHSTNIKGTGLGLPIAYGLTKLMDGQIQLDSTLGSGTRFQVLIPLIKGKPLLFNRYEDKSVLVLSEDEAHINSYMCLLKSMFKKVDNVTNARGLYDIILIDDYVLTKTNHNLMINQYQNKDAKVILFTKHSYDDHDAHFTFDVPVTRKSFLDGLTNSHNQLTITEEELFTGHVLVVDDNEINRIAMIAILERKGFQCDSASSGLEAIEFIKKNHYHMIMMDIKMPRMDGYETSKKIRTILKNERQIPIIVITANTYLNDYDTQMATYVDDIIFKPINMQILNNVIKKHLHTENQITVPKNLLSFNKRIFNDLFDLNINSGIKMIRRFLAEYDKDIDELKDVMEKNDRDLIYKKLHYLKGPLSYLGAERMIYLINELMKKIMSNNHILGDEFNQLIEEGYVANKNFREYIQSQE